MNPNIYNGGWVNEALPATPEGLAAVRALPFILGLLCPSLAHAQDDTTVDTAEPPEAVQTLPADTVVTLPDGSEEELEEAHLAFLLEPPQLDLSEGIVKMPTGSHIVVLEEGVRTPYMLPGKYWLLPDSYYREAVTKGKQLDIYQPALERCTETSLEWQERTYGALQKCSDQFDNDETLIAEQVQTIATLESEVTSLTYQRNNARRQRNVAWAITGGLVLGASTVIVVAIAP